MGKASSAKKVARAARAGESTTTSERREIGFPALVAAVIILGLLLVGFARQTRDAEVRPTLADHWHNAYGVWDCVSGDFQAPYTSEFDPQGIHSHQDGVIHIHPFTASVTGSQATLGVFLEAMFTTVNNDMIQTSGGATLDVDGVECDGEPAVIQVLRWDDAFNPGTPEVFTDDFSSIRLSSDGGAFTIARAPLGADIPIREASVTQLAAVMGSDQESDGTNTTALPPAGPSDFGEDTVTITPEGEGAEGEDTEPEEADGE